ncbi:carboxypeptidase-like regulatory domain-containing protein [Deinococcus sp. Leaf326]|uniref:carboxypeptidase-like regulatory domain-containing protein n=1 Tax=Deinococcus sp. Leaf326 TaxID=1736338 RepID=UPI00070086E0|nr:carboxypeptidase-like regulatory domain-containing protein [Deinococcus sp. Leaf326]KQR22738.1 hypothetical protein ASF71_06050 [Deinococcus sp. Leaf326]
MQTHTLVPTLVTLGLLLGGLSGRAAAQGTVQNTAALHTAGPQNPLVFSSNTVELRRELLCSPALSLGPASGALALPATGALFIPFTVRQNGAGGEILLEAQLPADLAPSLRVSFFADDNGDGAPDGAAFDRLTLAAGESRTLLLGISSTNPLILPGALDVGVSASCGERRTVASVRVAAPAAALNLAHSAGVEMARTGERVPFVLSVAHSATEALMVTVRAVVPAHGAYVASAGDGQPQVEVGANGQVLTWTRRVAPGERLTLPYTLRVLGSGSGRLAVPAQAEAVAGIRLLQSAPATAQVRVADPVGALGTLIGRVYVDRDGDNRFGEGDQPVVGARVVLPGGLQVLTDAAGGYTFRDLAPGPWLVGLDPASLKSVDQTAGQTWRQTAEVRGLARADFALSAQAPDAAAAPSAPAADQTVAAPTGLIRSPRPGTVVREGTSTGVVLEGPAQGTLSLWVNGERVADDRLGQQGPGEAAGTRRLTYVGVALRPGRNVIEARTDTGSETAEVTVAGAPRTLSVRPVTLLADGHTPLEIEILALDEAGVAGGRGFVTVGTDAEPLTPDAAPAESGYQVALSDGVARLRLAPVTTGREITVNAALGALQTGARLYAGQAPSSLSLYQGSVGVQFGGDGTQLRAQARAYAEGPLLGGQVRAAVDTGGLPDSPTAPRFPVTGSANEAQPALRSADGFAVRYDRGDLTLGYFAAPLGVPGLSALGAGTALRAEVRGQVRVQGFAGLVAPTQGVVVLRADGGRTYRLPQTPQPGTERVTVRSGGRERFLVPGQDYTLEDNGLLVLAAPLSAYDDNFSAVELVVNFAPLGSARTLVAAGVGAEYVNGPWSVQVGAARLERLYFGASAAYTTPELRARVTYAQDPLYPQGRLSAELRGEQGPLSADASVSAVAGERPLGTAAVSYRLGDTHLTLRQRFETTGARSEATAEHHFGALTLGAGADYDWNTGSFGVLGLGRYDAGRLSTEVSHAQPLGSTGRAPETRFGVRYAVTDTLSAEARVRQIWGSGPDAGPTGEFALRQRVGLSNFSVAYTLPGAAGESSRARFGLDVPLTLNEHLGANLSASVDRDMETGTFGTTLGAGLRYADERIVATLGGEYGLSAGQSRLALRGGVTGQLGEGQTLSLDANGQLLPTPEGRVGLSYALRREDFSLLTTHRLSTASTVLGTGVAGAVLEGEAQANVALARTLLNRPLSLQPGVSYRVPLSDPEGSVLGLSLGAVVEVTDRFGVGAGAGVIWLPALGQTERGATLDLRYRLTGPEQPLWVVAGYTWGRVPGAAGGLWNTQSGFSVRFDFSGGHVSTGAAPTDSNRAGGTP